MSLSHALPAEPFATQRPTEGRQPLSFAPPREVVEVRRPGVAPTQAGSRRERRVILALVALAHLAALVGIAQLARQPAPVPETPISVALIELPVAIPPAVAPAPPAKPVVEQPSKAPRPTPRAQERVPQRPAPAPTIESASAISADALPEPRQEAVREAPAPPPAPARAAPEAPAPLVAARFDAAYLNNPAPAYPMVSRRMREEGKVLLRVQVTAEGLPDRVELAESSGFGRLDAAARESVLHWRFVPAKQEGRAVDAWVVVPIVFKLEGH